MESQFGQLLKQLSQNILDYINTKDKESHNRIKPKNTHTLPSDCTENVVKFLLYSYINHIFCVCERLKFWIGFRIKYNWSTLVYRQFTITFTKSSAGW